MAFKIDHVVLAWSWLEALAAEFAAAGLETDYGGIHSNGVTHMSLLGFDDGSYIEIVSVRQPGQQSPWWQDHIVANGGPSGWAVEVDDVAVVAGRLKSLGVLVDGPHHMHRSRPEGVVVEWDLAFIGEDGAGAMHPFILKDRTPRRRRVKPSKSVSGTELGGIHTVVLAVSDVAAMGTLFQKVYGLPAPVPIESPSFPGALVQFPGEPVALAAPAAPDDWIAQRIAQFGATPCAYLIASRDLDASRGRVPLTRAECWGDDSVAWVNSEALRGLHLGVLQTAD